MNQDELDECFAALGVTDATPLTQGGQKLVFTAGLAGSPVIVKIVALPVGPSGQLVLERAHREVELLAEVSSDFVVSVLSDAIEVGDPTFAVAWVEERLDGVDLAGLLTESWSDAQVLDLLRDIAGALDACHSLEVVHRDLSPGNVRALPSGRFVLMDPGVARHLRRTAITGHWQPGTPGFRSPEHVPGGSASSASDVFALGALAHVAKSGRFPIDPGDPQHEYDRRLLHTQAPPIRTLCPETDPQLAQIIDRCLQRQPARRFLDGAELLDAIEAMGDLR